MGEKEDHRNPDDIPEQELASREIQESPGPPANPQLLSSFDWHVLSLITFGAIFGTLCRLGLVALFTAPEGADTPVFPLVWTQGTGSFFFGLFCRKQKTIEKFWPAAHIALRVGFSGCVATFATWQVQSFQAFSNFENEPKGWIHYATAGLSHLFVTITSTWFSLHFGRHIGDHLPDIRRKVKPLPLLYRNLFCVFALLCWLAALLIFLLTSELTFRSGRRIAFALTLAPPAAIIRWWLSWRLNRISPSWIRWGTWISNMSSTSIAATMTLLQVVTPLNSTLSLFQCQTLQAIQDGFCGGLSTIPAILEQAETIHNNNRRWWKSWVYVFVFQYLCGLCIVILILGTGWWVHGKGTICSA